MLAKPHGSGRRLGSGRRGAALAAALALLTSGLVMMPVVAGADPRDPGVTIVPSSVTDPDNSGQVSTTNQDPAGDQVLTTIFGSNTGQGPTTEAGSTTDLGSTTNSDSTSSGSGASGPGPSGPANSGPADSGPADSGPSDSGPANSGPSDSGSADSGPSDSGPAGTTPAPETGTGPDGIGYDLAGAPPASPADDPLPAAPPSPPVVDPSNGSQITGTADSGTTVTVRDADGNEVTGCVDVLVDSAGRFSCRPDLPVVAHTDVTVTAKTDQGDLSDPVSLTIQSLGIEIADQVRHRLDYQTVTGFNFNPGERIHLTVASKLLDIGYADADDSGQVAITFRIPAGFDLGVHTAKLAGEFSGSASASFEVLGDLVILTGGTVERSSAGPVQVALLMTGAAILIGVATARAVHRDRSRARQR